MHTINYTKNIYIPVIAGLLTSCTLIPVDHTATAKLPDNLEISITLEPILSLQSDWERQLTIRHHDEVVSEELPIDGGDWRGTILYIHSSGSLLLYEGENDCYEFRINPIHLVQLTDEKDNCGNLKHLSINRINADITHCSEKILANCFIPSKYFENLHYVGIFEELPGKQGRPLIRFRASKQIRFRSSRDVPEPTPKILY